jgi:hypothetical protein
MAKNPKFAASGQGSASDANAGRGSRSSDVSDEAAGRGNGWSMGPAAFAHAFPFASSMLFEPLRSLIAATTQGAAQAAERTMAPTEGRASPAGGWTKETWEYWVDAMQRQILFWDVLRKRGNQAIEHHKAGKPPVLVFDYEMVLDGRKARAPGQLCPCAHQARSRRDDRPEQAAVRHR